MLKPDLTGRTSGTTVPVFVRAGLIARLGALIPKPSRGAKIAIVTDSIVARLYAASVSRSLKSAGWRVALYRFTPGEGIKTARVIDALHESWLRAGYDRSTPVLALGGGTVGDAAGFAAATFMRGLPLWQIPTTLLGQVDSAIGGKVGINHPKSKNLIGSFYQPAAIVIDPELLQTLPAREIRSGLAEVVKYGVIHDRALFRRCEAMMSGWVDQSSPVDYATIKRCVAIKLNVVQSDERDTGRRHILNFGHTLGHAFEAWGQFKTLRHGEAVTLGMVAASEIAQSRGILSKRDFKRISEVCHRIAPSQRAARFEPKDIMPYLASDKKRTAGKNAWVLPLRIGEVTIVREVTDKEIRAAIEFVRTWLV